MTTTVTLAAHLLDIGACSEARKWAVRRSAAKAWEQCQHADWLLWWAARTDANTHQQIVLAACACARTALKYVPDGEERPRVAIEAAERWANDPTAENKFTADAAYAAVYAAANAAAYAAEDAANAAYAAATANAAADAAYAAAYAAANAAAAANVTRAASSKEMCEIIRGILAQPWKEPE